MKEELLIQKRKKKKPPLTGRKCGNLEHRYGRCTQQLTQVSGNGERADVCKSLTSKMRGSPGNANHIRGAEDKKQQCMLWKQELDRQKS